MATSKLRSFFDQRRRSSNRSYFGRQVSIRLESIDASSYETNPFELVRNGKLEQLKQFTKNTLRQDLRLKDENGKTLLHAAVVCKNTPIIQFLLEDDTISTNSRDNDGNTVLHLAIKNRDIATTDLLIESGADDSIKNNKQDPPLHLILRQYENPEQLSALMKHPINLQVKGLNGSSILHVIAETDNLEALEIVHNILCANPSSPQFELGIQDDNGTTPIHLAARMGSYRVLDFIISKAISEWGFNPEDVLHYLCDESNTPLHYAVESGYKQVVDVLLKYGASPIHSIGSNLPPCHLACSQNKLDILKAMVESCGLEILESRDVSGSTPLHCCARSVSSDELISYLVDQGSKLNAQDNTGCTPLHSAVIFGNMWRVEFLISRGADPSIMNHDGCNSLQSSILWRRGEIFKVIARSSSAALLSVTTDTNGSYPVHLAVSHKFSQAVPTLLSLMNITNASLTCLTKFSLYKDKEGNNFLHSAARAGDSTSLNYLLTLPCCRYMLNDPNLQGETPLHLAALSGSIICIGELVGNGAIIHKSHNGNTPLMVACLHGHLEAAKALYKAFPFQKNWSNNDGDTSLHMAARSKNLDIIIMGLDFELKITLNKSNESFFDIILSNLNAEVAIAVLKHTRWEECLDFCSPDLPHPVLRIIESIPEAFQIILDQSATYASTSPQHREYWEEFNFKYVTLSKKLNSRTADDSDHLSTPSQAPTVNTNTNSGVRSRASRDGGKQQEQTDVSTVPTGNGIPVNESQVSLLNHNRSNGDKSAVIEAKQIDTQPTSQQSHQYSVLNHLIKYKHRGYLVHPIIINFLDLKWRRYARTIYVMRFLLFLLFTLAFSAFIWVTPPPSQVIASTSNLDNTSNSTMGDTIEGLGVTSHVFRFLTIVFAIPNLIFWLFGVYITGLNCLKHFFFEIDFWIHGLTLLCTFIFVIPWLGLDTLFWELGAIAIYLAWFSVGLHLQLFDTSGVYISMIFSTSRNVFRVLLISFFLVCAFAFPLYILVATAPRLRYTTISTSLFSVFSSLHAAINFENLVLLETTSQLQFAALTFILVVLLTILMPIVLINLLIGLAVGDIAKIQQEAIISQRGVEVHALKKIDEHFPKRWIQRHSQQMYRHYPNKKRLLTFKKVWRAFWHGFEFDEAEQPSPVKVVDTTNDEVKEYHTKLSELEENLEKVILEQIQQQETLKRMEDMLSKLVAMLDT